MTLARPLVTALVAGVLAGTLGLAPRLPSGDPNIVAVAQPPKATNGDGRVTGAAKKQGAVNGSDRRSSNSSVGGR